MMMNIHHIPQKFLPYPFTYLLFHFLGGMLLNILCFQSLIFYLVGSNKLRTLLLIFVTHLITHTLLHVF